MPTLSFATSVAILGFTPFERSTFEAFLQLTARRTPAYQLEDDPFEADFVIVDADDAALVRRVRTAGLLPRCVMLGALGHPGAALHRERPFNLKPMLRALDALPRRVRASRPAVDVPALAAAPFMPRAAIQIPVPAVALSLSAPPANPSRSLPGDRTHP